MKCFNDYMDILEITDKEKKRLYKYYDPNLTEHKNPINEIIIPFILIEVLLGKKLVSTLLEGIKFTIRLVLIVDIKIKIKPKTDKVI